MLGQFAPLRGPDQDQGRAARQGAALAVEEANEADSRQRVVVLHADAGDSDVTAAAQAVRLVSVNRVAALFGPASDRLDRFVLTPSGASNPTLLITPGSTTGRPPRKPIFALGVAAVEQGRVLAHWAIQEAKVSSLVLLSDGQHPVSLAIADAVRQSFQEAGGKPITEVVFRSIFDVPERARAIVADAPQAVLVLASPGEAVLAVRELRQAGLPAETPILLGGDGELAPRLNSERGLPTLVVATAFLASEASETGKAFVEKYRSRFGNDPDATALLAYDGFRLLIRAGRAGQTFHPVRLREELAKTSDDQGPTGPLRFVEDQTVRRAVFLVKIEGRQTKLLKRYDPLPP